MATADREHGPLLYGLSCLFWDGGSGPEQTMFYDQFIVATRRPNSPYCDGKMAGCWSRIEPLRRRSATTVSRLKSAFIPVDPTVSHGPERRLHWMLAA